MRTRVLIGSVLIAVLVALFWLDLYWGGYFICLIAMVLTGAGLHEFFGMTRRVGLAPFEPTGVAFGVALLPYYLWSEVLPGWLGQKAFAALILAPLVALVLALMVRTCVRRAGLASQVRNIGVTVLGVLYIALPMTFLVQTRFLNEGWNLILLVVAATKATDIGAYFAGVLFGRHKLAPRISPNKTVEGAVGGVLASAIATAALAHGMTIHTLIDRGLPAILSFGLVLGVAAQIGDLTESVVKRSTGTKDSGNMLPAFGGVLDLVDSFLVSAPVSYFLLSLFAAGAK